MLLMPIVNEKMKNIQGMTVEKHHMLSLGLLALSQICSRSFKDGYLRSRTVGKSNGCSSQFIKFD